MTATPRQAAAAARRALRIQRDADRAARPPVHYPHLCVIVLDDATTEWDGEADEPIKGRGLSVSVTFDHRNEYHSLFPVDQDIYDLDTAATAEAWADMLATIAGWCDSHGYTHDPIEPMSFDVDADQVVHLHPTGGAS